MSYLFWLHAWPIVWVYVANSLEGLHAALLDFIFIGSTISIFLYVQKVCLKPNIKCNLKPKDVVQMKLYCCVIFIYSINFSVQITKHGNMAELIFNLVSLILSFNIWWFDSCQIRSPLITLNSYISLELIGDK